MHPPATALRGRLALGAILMALLTTLALPHAAHAAFSDNNNCFGSVKAGDKDPLGINDNLVAYTFACEQPITSYSLIFPSHSIDYTETEVFGLDGNGNVTGADSFSCNGELPGYGINCVGTYEGLYDKLTGQVDLENTKLCDEPRVEVLATATYASFQRAIDGSLSMSGGLPVITTNTAGPFSLGRPKGCPKSKGKHVLLIPPSADTSADTPGDPTATPLG